MVNGMTINVAAATANNKQEINLGSLILDIPIIECESYDLCKH
jgi:hypothetical protein